jgi:hypothetical protein
MELTFTLRNGTRAGIRPGADMEDLVVARPCLERSAPGQDVALIFHVPNKQVLDRMMERFSASGC